MQKITRSAKLKTHVVLHGGLGNQLFQWAFGHRIRNCGADISFIFFQRSNNVAHASSSLKSFLSNCEHGNFLESIKPQSRIKQVFFDPTFHKNPFRFIPGYVNATVYDPFLLVEPERASKLRYNFGYYQNWQLVQPIAEIILPELFLALDRREKSKVETDLYGSEVIHIRQNDTKSPEHMVKLGVLSDLYYQKLPPKSKIKRIVLTDDINGARQVLNGIEVDGFYGPGDLNTYQALGVMSQSATLFAANSTLSWWGGYLARSRGATVYIPHPYFRNFHTSPGMAFADPSFSLLDSHFMVPVDSI